MARGTALRHRTKTVGPPIGGLNKFDAISAMPINDARYIVNWIPQATGLRVRKGYVEHCINLGSEVRSILPYYPKDGSLSVFKLFAATDSAIYDVTNSTNTPSSVVTLTNNPYDGRFSTVMFANAGGNFMSVCSQNGGYWTYNGSAWTKTVAGTAAGQISGPSPDNLCFVTLFKRRLWFIEKNTSKAWYLPVDQLTGTATLFDFGTLFSHGGGIAFLASWSLDAGAGIDDYFVIGGQNGDVLVYRGTDPNTDFTLVGVWFVGKMPVGRRNFVQYGGDLLVLSETGLNPISYITRGGAGLLRANTAVDYIKKIQPAMAEECSGSLTSYGWDLAMNTKENLLIVNRPQAGLNLDRQYALYTPSNGWCEFYNVPIRCMVYAEQVFWFGTSDGKVCRMEGYVDAVPFGQTTGQGITGSVSGAYDYFGAVGQYKEFTMARPVFLAKDKPSVSVTMNTDFKDSTNSSVSSYSQIAGSRWDSSTWDVSKWSGDYAVFNDWFTAVGIGYAGSLRIDTVTSADTFLASIDYMWQPGGPL